MRTRFIYGLLVIIAAPLGAQSTPELLVNDSSPFRPLTLPTPNTYRTGSGRPAPRYWQQRADYRIAAALDTATKEIRGRETIHYSNRSPDALPYLWLFVEQNLCAPSSITNVLNQPPLTFGTTSFDFACHGFPPGQPGGPTLEYLRIGGRDAARAKFGTTLRIDLAKPLAPNQSIDIEIGWHFPVPEQGGGRMGRDGALYELGQWYPRMAVYDDVHGWNHEPYIGAGEFYLEYGRYDVKLTVPAGYLIAATGELRNAERVLTKTERDRLRLALRSDTAIAIIARGEAADAARTRPSLGGALTWHFTADSVRDFAWAGGPGMLWDASGYDGILIETMYRPNADKWMEANRIARGAIKRYSEQWFHYPYSHATTVEGPVGGMEYPMLTFVPNSPTREEQQWVIAHEFGHEWFPMIVGSNERLYPWMDEGFNTFIDYDNAALYFTGTPTGDTIQLHPLHAYSLHARPGDEQPLITNPTESRDLEWTAYQKPALMMQLLRNEVLGADRFDKAFREYIRVWAFKHPTPADFFRVMRDASGMELDWYWREWIFETARLDQAVDSITTDSAGGSVVHVSNRATMVMPAELALEFADGSRASVKLPVEMWNLGPRFNYRVPGGKRVRRAEVDPRQALPDIDRANNAWPRGGTTTGTR
jgi:Peptidase family M1 domain